MNSYPCFMISHINKVQHSLLVVDMRSDCEARPGHPCRATEIVGIFDARVDQYGIAEYVDVPFPEHTGSMWPTMCAFCHRAFTGDGVFRSTVQELLYVDSHGLVMTLASADIGAMWNEVGNEDNKPLGPDGLCLMVKTPGGNWCIDGASWENGKKKSDRVWTRTGTPPAITVVPSIHILTSNLDGTERRTLYHGWLKEGVLIDA